MHYGAMGPRHLACALLCWVPGCLSECGLSPEPAPPSKPATTPRAAPPPLSIESCLAAIPDDMFVAVGRSLCAEMQQHQVPGAAAAIAIDGEIVWSFAAGTRCEGSEAPVKTDTPFRLGSLTKMLTASVAVDLGGTAALHLDKPVTVALPGLRFIGGDAPTLRALLMHRSRLRDRTVVPGQQAATVESLGAWTLTPGAAEFSYTNAGYAIAGAAVAAAAGTDLETALRTRLARPAGMTTLALADGREVPGASCGHTLTGETLSVAQDFETLASGARWAAPAGAAVASAEDLVRFAVATSPGKPLAHLSALWTDPGATSDGDDYGLGVRVRLGVEHTLVHHSGDTGTFHAELYWIPELGFAAAVVSNRPRPLGATMAAALTAFDPDLSL